MRPTLLAVAILFSSTANAYVVRGEVEAAFNTWLTPHAVGIVAPGDTVSVGGWNEFGIHLGLLWAFGDYHRWRLGPELRIGTALVTDTYYDPATGATVTGPGLAWRILIGVRLERDMVYFWSRGSLFLGLWAGGGAAIDPLGGRGPFTYDAAILGGLRWHTESRVAFSVVLSPGFVSAWYGILPTATIALRLDF